VAVDSAGIAALREAGFARWLKEALGPTRSGLGRPQVSALTRLQAVALAYEAGWLFEPALAGRAAELDGPAAVVVTWDRWLEADSPRGPWRWRGPQNGPLWDLVNAGAQAPRDSDVDVRWSGLGALHDRTPREVWLRGFEAIQAGLARGDFYQVNLSRRLELALPDLAPAEVGRFAAALFGHVRRAQPAAFAGLMPLAEDRWLVSGSPESLLTWRADTRRVTTWPIKGTRRAGTDADEDATLRAELAASSKDRAEHVMIVDLMRNDLGRVAVPGSVSVPALMAPLPLRTLTHLVSEVACTLAPGRDLVDLLAAVFPGGSVTGAPRIAAMEAIAALEDSPRGFYCGTLGLVTDDGRASFAILIRNSIATGTRLQYSAGGGLVMDSQAEAEWAETETKADALARALRGLQGA
jgi:anthranilate/para-aminobenzoate synthase component I